jgi:hypothetical protein
VVGLRHDVDEWLGRARDFAELEHDRGLPATYFALHTADYWAQPHVVTTLLRMQNDYGHEIGWHNDLVTFECIRGGDARELLTRELSRLRAAGLHIDGTAAHGSPACYRYGYHNDYFFFGGEPLDGFPNLDTVEGPLGRRPVPRGTLDEFQLRYDAYRLDNDLYFSDAAFDQSGKRWHTDQLDLRLLRPGTRTIILTHPDHWDSTFFHKLARYRSKVIQGLTT